MTGWTGFFNAAVKFDSRPVYFSTRSLLGLSDPDQIMRKYNYFKVVIWLCILLLALVVAILITQANFVSILTIDKSANDSTHIMSYLGLKTFELEEDVGIFKSESAVNGNVTGVDYFYEDNNGRVFRIIVNAEDVVVGFVVVEEISK